MLNAGCRITSIQKFLGHKRLNTTLTYARAHDQTVAEDYYQAMGSVERRLQLVGEPKKNSKTLVESELEQLLALAEQLALPEISQEKHLDMAMQFKLVLIGNGPAYQVLPEPINELVLLEHPPPL